MNEERTWVDPLLQSTLRTFAEVETAGAELLDQLRDGVALTSDQKQSLGQVLASLENILMHDDDEGTATSARTFFPTSSPVVPVNWVGRGKRDS